MKKVFKLANNELKKTFMRPSMYILTALLFLALVICSFVFKPTETRREISITGDSIFMVYNEFTEKENSFNAQITSAKNNYEAYLETDNTKNTFKQYFVELNNVYFENLFLSAADYATGNLSKKDDVINCLISTKTYAGTIMNYMSSNLKDKQLGFYLPQKVYDDLFKYLTKLSESIKKKAEMEEFTQDAMLAEANFILKNFRNDNIIQSKIDSIKNLEEINKDDFKTKFDAIINEYYYKNFDRNTGEIIGKLKAKRDVVYNYYSDAQTKIESGELTKQDAIDGLSYRIVSYQAFVYECTKILNDEFILTLAGNKKDSELENYIGFSSNSVYNTREELSKAYFFYNNTDLNSNDFLDAFNFNTNSGYETNAYDFTIFAMQILMILIIVFCIFFAGSSIVGEQSLGTLKMTATRPYSRNKLLSGKILSCVFVGIILMLVSFVASFVVGTAMYGFTFKNVLVVLNSTNVMILNPFVLLILYLFSCLINIVFYISLAMVISLILKNNVVSVFLSSIVYFATIIINSLVSSSVIKFIPTVHLDVYKYLTNSSLGFLKFNVIPDVNLYISLGVIIACGFVMNLASHLIFTRRDIA